MAAAATNIEKHDFSHKTDDHFCPACAFSSSSEDMLINQLEFYFSQDNIVQDHYLRSQMDEENYVPILTICNFTKVKQYIEDVNDPEQFIATLVQNKSDVLQVDDLGEKIRAQSGPVKYRLVVRDVPPTHTRDDIHQMFNTCDIKIISAEPTGCNSTWYLGFESEDDSHEAMEHLKRNYKLNVYVKKVMSGHYQGTSKQHNFQNSVQGHFWSGNYQVPQTTAPVTTNGNIATYSQYNDYGTANWTQLNRTIKGPKGTQPREMPPFSRTMYQPFRRGGYEQGVPSTSGVFIQRPFGNVNYQPVQSRAHRVRPQREKERTKVHSARRIDGASPDVSLTLHMQPRLTDPLVRPKSSPKSPTKPKLPPPTFEMNQFDFPSLCTAGVEESTPTPPPVNSKAEFDQLKPGQAPVQKDEQPNIADLLRRSPNQSPSPGPIINVAQTKPIGTPLMPVENESQKTWGARNIAQAIKASNAEKTRKLDKKTNEKKPKPKATKHQTPQAPKVQQPTPQPQPKPAPITEPLLPKTEETEDDGWSIVPTKARVQRVAVSNIEVSRQKERQRRISDRLQPIEQYNNFTDDSMNQFYGRRKTMSRRSNESDTSSIKSTEQELPGDGESFGPSLGNAPFPKQLAIIQNHRH